MQIIDVNTMIGEWAPRQLRFSGADGLLMEMDRLGIAKSLVYSSGSLRGDPVRGNSLLVEQLKGRERLVPVMAATPLLQLEFGGAEGLAAFARDHGIRAARLFPDEHNFTLNLWDIGELLGTLEAYGVPVMLDCRALIDPLAAFWNNIHDMARAFPKLPIFLLTVGYREARVLYKLFDACVNLYIDTSTYIAYEGIEETVRLFGSGRLLFGSRMPFIEAGAALGRLLYARISPQDRENIAHRNIEAMLGRAASALAGGGVPA